MLVDHRVETRTAYHRALDELWVSMADLARLDAVAIDRASSALLTADRDAAEAVLGGQRAIAARAGALERRATGLIARQQPVASDLRLLISALAIAPGLARMGELACHVARTARMRAPETAVVTEVHDLFLAMGLTASDTARNLADVLVARDAGGAATLERADTVMDVLHRQLFTRALAPDWPHPVEPAIDAALLGRFYERFADQAVTVACRVHWIMTGGRYPRSTRR